MLQDTTPLTHIIFVCQGGRLEFESLLLALTIRNRVKFNYRMTARIPRPISSMSYPSDTTLQMLQDLGMQLDEFENEFLENKSELKKPLLLTNKIFSLSAEPEASLTLFIDSDTVVHRILEQDPVCVDQLILKNIGYYGANILKHWWSKLEQSFDFQFPDKWISVEAQNRPTIDLPQFFNSSLVGIPTRHVNSIKASWLENYSALTSMAFDPPKPYQEEQAALAVAVHQSDLKYTTSFQGVTRGFRHYGNSLHNNGQLIDSIHAVLTEHPRERSHLAKDPQFSSIIESR